MNVTILYGGPSAEREVSLVSGKAVIDGLISMGHAVFGSDGFYPHTSGLLDDQGAARFGFHSI